MWRIRFMALVLVLASVASPGPTHAKTLRIASAFDPQTMDPHAIALLYHSRIAFQVYDSLVHRNESFTLEPGPALPWQMTSPTVWRFKPRAGVRFHDGSAFNVEDAVCSIQRAMGPPSQRSFQLKGVSAARKVAATAPALGT